MIKVSESVNLKFIDLFSGLGGFHLALSDLGHSCVFACDIDKELRDSYFKNFGIQPEGDIRKILAQHVPKHDILCAGFPCQPFSKAGLQEGLEDKERGALFYEIMKIINHHNPKFLLMENVPNILNHNGGKTWKKIEQLLRDAGYDVTTNNLSPHHFGIPQVRVRTYIVAKKGELSGFTWPDPNENQHSTSILSVLDKNPKDARKIPDELRARIDVWQELLDILPKDEKLPHPLWSMEFGATYPYEKTTPFKMKVKDLRKYKGSFGVQLKGDWKREIFKQLPSHAIREDKLFPRWKIAMIRRNREFYSRNKKILDPWLQKIMKFPSSFQKLEWNVGDGIRNMNRYVLQCRGSGLRVKRLTTSPSLVAMNCSQIPIIPWENRYMTADECKRLQSMDRLKDLPTKRSKRYCALGNAVNVEVLKLIASSLVKYGGNKLGSRPPDN